MGVPPGAGRGRPLRFLALVAIVWLGIRVAPLIPRVVPPLFARVSAPAAAATMPEWVRSGMCPAAPPTVSAAAPVPPTAPEPAPASCGLDLTPLLAGLRLVPVPVAVPVRTGARGAIAAGGGHGAPLQVPMIAWSLPEGTVTEGDPPHWVPSATSATVPIPAALPAPGTGAPAAVVGQQAPPPQRVMPLAPRWRVSGWVIARPGTGIGAGPVAAQLGGSQAGARIAWSPVSRARVALFGRVDAPMVGRGGELAVGAEWQPTRLPVRLVAEQRMGLAGQPGGPGVGVIAGGEQRVGPVRVEGYGQAGVLNRGETEAYADGAVRVLRGIGKGGRSRWAVGVGAWGAAQRDGQRLDVGPTLITVIPVRGQNLRAALDWRQRVAGQVRPGSGPALSLGADF